jgi:hypothetical protein
MSETFFTQMETIEVALHNLGHDFSRHGCSLDLEAAAKAVRNSHADVVFNLVESLAQQGRLIQVVPCTAWTAWVCRTPAAPPTP